MINIVIIAIILAYCAYVVVNEHRKSKIARENGDCAGSCIGCSGCSSIDGDTLVARFHKDHPKEKSC